MTTVAHALLHPEESPSRPKAPAPPRATILHYDAIVDYLLAHPGARYQEVAAHMQRGAIWVSLVMKSDSFQEHYRRRRMVIDEVINDAVRQNVAQVAIKAAGLLTKRMDENPLGTTTEQLVTVLDKSTQRLGFGQQPAGPAVQVNTGGGGSSIFVADASAIERARARLRAVQEEMEPPAPTSPPAPKGPAPAQISGSVVARETNPGAGPDLDDVTDLEPIEDGDVTPVVGRDA